MVEAATRLTAQNEVGRLRRLVLKHARTAWPDAAAIDAQWERLGYLSRPDAHRAVGEYDRFVRALSAMDVDISFLPEDSTEMS